MRSYSGLSLVMMLLVACGPDAPEAPAVAPQVEPEAPVHGSLQMELGGQPFNAHWMDVNGLAIADGDLLLGTTDEVLAMQGDGLTSARTANAGRYWPTNTIPYRFGRDWKGDLEVSTDERDAFLAAIAEWEKYTPLRFVEDMDREASNYILVHDSKVGFPTRCLTQIGMRSSATDLWIGGSCRGAWLTEAVGHALGMLHEHQRPDAALFVDVDWSCAPSDLFVEVDHRRPTGSTTGGGPYNFESLSFSSSYQWTRRAGQPPRPPRNVMLTPSHITFDVTLLFTPPGARRDALYQEPWSGSVFSATYESATAGPVVFDNDAADLRGAAASSHAVGILDGFDDSRDPTYVLPGDNPGRFRILSRLDLAGVRAALPGEPDSELEDPANWAFETNPGRADWLCPVLKKRGSDFSTRGDVWQGGRSLHNAGDLSTLFQLYDHDRRNGEGAYGTDLGTDTAVGDFDGDGLQDVAASMPGDDLVALFRGAYVQTRTSGVALQVGWENLEHRAASVLAAGDFDGDGYDDLAIGAPDHAGGAGAVTIVMGAAHGLDHGGDSDRTGDETPLVYKLPFLRPAHLGGGFDASSTAFTSTDLPDFDPATCPVSAGALSWGRAGDAFGAALHVTDLNGDGFDDLLVGAPGAESPLDARDPASRGGMPGFRDTGVVLVLLGRSRDEGTPLSPSHVVSPYTHKASGIEPLYLGSHEGARFGASITTFDSDGDGCEDVFVGAPEDVATFVTSPAETAGTHLGSPASRPGRVFGFHTDLGDAGCAPLRRTDACVTGDLVAESDFEEPDGNDGARYGASLAGEADLLRAGGTDESLLVVGSPGAPAMLDGSPTGAAGRVDTYRQPHLSAAARGPKVPWAALRQSLATSGPDGCDEANDQFGFSVGTTAPVDVDADGSIDVPGVILVGSPGDSNGCTDPADDTGAVYVFQTSGTTVGYAAHNVADVLNTERGMTTPPLTRYGESITPAFWDNNSDGVEGFLVGLPRGPGRSSGGTPFTCSGAIETRRGISTTEGGDVTSPGTLIHQ